LPDRGQQRHPPDRTPARHLRLVQATAARATATVDSYLSSTNLANGMTYDDHPVVHVGKTNRTVNLRDVLDFRPMRSNFEFTATALVFAASDASATPRI
jgi:hypothetical protein